LAEWLIRSATLRDTRLAIRRIGARMVRGYVDGRPVGILQAVTWNQKVQLIVHLTLGIRAPAMLGKRPVLAIG
jgi:hypothetical protein